MKGSYAIIKKTTRVAAPVVRCQYDERGQYRQLFSTWIIADSAEKIQNEILNLKWWKIYISSWKNYTSCEENCPWNYKNASFVISVHDEEVFFMPYKDKSKQQAAQRKYDAKRAGERTRGYATIVYPESAPADWKEILADLKIQVLISPLHDQDVNPTGEPKKPHYHIMLIFEGPKAAHRPERLLQHLVG